MAVPERQYVRLLSIVRRQKGAILARTFDELSDGTQVKAVFLPKMVKPVSVRKYRSTGRRGGNQQGPCVRVRCAEPG